MSRGRRSLHSRRRPMSEINVVPYIDVMLVLLVIFMVTAPLLTQGVKVDLPQAAAKPIENPKGEETLVVSMDAVGRYYVNLGTEQDEPVGYRSELRNFDNPTDISEHLDNSFPKQDSILPKLLPDRWAEIKNGLFDKHGLKLGFSYQALFQYATETLSGQDTAAGG